MSKIRLAVNRTIFNVEKILLVICQNNSCCLHFSDIYPAKIYRYEDTQKFEFAYCRCYKFTYISLNIYKNTVIKNAIFFNIPHQSLVDNRTGNYPKKHITGVSYKYFATQSS